MEVSVTLERDQGKTIIAAIEKKDYPIVERPLGLKLMTKQSLHLLSYLAMEFPL